MSNARIQNNVVLFPLRSESLQITTGATTSSTSYSNTSLASSYTPRYATSKILVMVTGNANGNSQFRIVRDGSPLTNGYAPNNTRGNFTIFHWDSADNTSSRTYTLQFRNYNGVGTAEFGFAGSQPGSRIMVTEFGA